MKVNATNNFDLLKEELIVNILENIEKISTYTQGLGKKEYYHNKHDVARKINKCLYRISVAILKLKIIYPEITYPDDPKTLKEAISFQWRNYVKIGTWLKKTDVRFAFIYQKAWYLATNGIHEIKHHLLLRLLPVVMDNIIFYTSRVENAIATCSGKVDYLDKITATCISFHLVLIDRDIDIFNKYSNRGKRFAPYCKVRAEMEQNPFPIRSEKFLSLASWAIEVLKKGIMTVEND